MENSMSNENQAIIDVAKASVEPFGTSFMGVYLAPDAKGNYQVIDLDRFNDVPRDYRALNKTFDDVDSFLAFLHSHNQDQAAEIWARQAGDRRSMSVTALLDPAPSGPSLRNLRLAFTETERWQDWKRVDNRWYDQEEFAEFLEDHADDLASPSAAEMLEIAQSIRATVGTVVEKGIRLDNGETQLVYKEDIEGKAGRAGQLEIPQQIKITVQPFTSSSAYLLDAKFRYRLVNRELKLSVKLMNADLMIERVFSGILDAVREGARDVPVYLGN